MFHRDVIILPMHNKCAYVKGQAYSVIRSSENQNKTSPIIMAYLEDSCFSSPHYQSIVPTKNSSVMEHYYSTSSGVKTTNKSVKLTVDTSVPNINDIDKAAAPAAVPAAAVLCMCSTSKHKCRACGELVCVFCATGEMNDHRHRDPERCKKSGRTKKSAK